MTIIKADPGFELLAAHHDGEFKIERSPIVAWRIEGDFAEPIALNPLCLMGPISRPRGVALESEKVWDPLHSERGSLFEPRAPSPTYQYYSIC